MFLAILSLTKLHKNFLFFDGLGSEHVLEENKGESSKGRTLIRSNSDAVLDSPRPSKAKLVKCDGLKGLF